VQASVIATLTPVAMLILSLCSWGAEE